MGSGLESVVFSHSGTDGCDKSSRGQTVKKPRIQDLTPSATVLGIVTAFMAAAVWREWPWWEYAFLSDGSAVAWLSSALLVANAAVAFVVTLIRAVPPVSGGGLSAALAFLAVDEQFQLHEQFKAALGASRLRNAPTLLVAAGGVVLLVLFWRHLLTRMSRALVALAVIVGLFALWVDLGSPPVVVGRLEEGFEVIAESLFLCGLLELARVHVQSGAAR
jgi:hypothetical protein